MLVILTVAMSLLTNQALAKERSLDECRKLERERTKLVNQGIVKDLDKGPEWARTNLPANRVNEILRYLKIFEKIQFQCQTVFAQAEAEQAARIAREKAKALALAHIPPPPEKRPKIIPKNIKKRGRAIPPLPIRRSPS